MILKAKYCFIWILLLSLFVVGCSAEKPALNAGDQKKEPESVKIEEQKIDVLETYTNEKYKFSFDIPVAWKNKYKIIQQEKIIYFVHSGFPEVEGKMLWIVVLTEEEFKELNAVPPSVPQSAILGRKNNLVYYYITPVAMPYIDNTEKSQELLEEWGKMHDALYEIPDGVTQRFHFKDLN
jgi:hypothetical protein